VRAVRLGADVGLGSRLTWYRRSKNSGHQPRAVDGASVDDSDRPQGAAGLCRILEQVAAMSTATEPVRSGP
jgi:hypothetical protein